MLVSRAGVQGEIDGAGAWSTYSPMSAAATIGFMRGTGRRTRDSREVPLRARHKETLARFAAAR